MRLFASRTQLREWRCEMAAGKVRYQIEHIDAVCQMSGGAHSKCQNANTAREDNNRDKHNIALRHATYHSR